MDSSPQAALAGKPEREPNALRCYVDELVRHPAFSPTEERLAAERLVAARVRRWAALLGYSPLTESILALIESRLAPEQARLRTELATLAIHAGLYRRSRTLTNERNFQASIDAVAPKLPALDLDGELAEQLVADVERLADNRRGPLLTVARMPGGRRPFEDWVRSCRQAQAEVRRETDAFARANLRLVVLLVRRFGHQRLPLADLIQEGNLGLLKAIERFDPARGFRFSTYAGWWIRHALSRAVYNKGRQIRLPVHAHDLLQKLVKVRRRFEAMHGREPTPAELARETAIPLHKIEAIQRHDHPLVSLDEPAVRDDERTRLEMLEDDEPTPDRCMELEQLGRGLALVLDDLQPMELDIVRRRFGLDGREQETLNQIADGYALSRERIRQIEGRAIAKIRAGLRALALIE